MTDRAQKPDADDRVVPFRPRSGARHYLPSWSSKANGMGDAPVDADTPVEDLAKFEGGEESDDFRQRMTVNLLAFGFTILLIAAGIWIVITLAETRKNQDCFLSGRRNCETIVAPPMERY